MYDRDGRAVRTQAYTYDMLGNMTGCTTGFADGQEEARTYAYGDPDQPSRRTQERVTSAGVTTSQALSYDTAGNLMASGTRTFTYTAEGRLASASDGGTLLTRYDYDADGVLAAQQDAVRGVTRVLSGDAEIRLDPQGQPVTRRIDDAEAGLVTVCQTLSGEQGETVAGEALYFTLQSPGAGGGDEWWVDDAGGWHHRSAAFTPWGESAADSRDAIASGLGWNGMTADPAGLYHMGEGERAYDPRERTFCQPDSLSPFDAGGLNERAYCAYRDPVNWHDPSGHVMLNRFAAREQLAMLDHWISATEGPPPTQAAAWWEWLLLGAAALAFVVGMVMSGGALAAVVPGIIGLIGIGVKGVGMAMRQGAPEYAAKMELAGDVLSSVGGLLMPMTGGGALTAGLLRTAEVASLGLSVASYALSESNPVLAEKLGWASMGVGLPGIAHTLVHGARSGWKKLREIRSAARRAALSPVARIVDDALGDISRFKALNPAARIVDDAFGDIRKYYGRPVQLGSGSGLMESINRHQPGVYIFEDTMKKSGHRRLNIVAHGKRVKDGDTSSFLVPLMGGGNSVIEYSEMGVAEMFQVVSKTYNLQKYDRIRLCTCFSANGGSNSLAQQMATLTGKPVKGFKGPLTANYTPEQIDELWQDARAIDQLTGIQTLTSRWKKGFEPRKTNPYHPFREMIQYLGYIAEPYRPVKFNP